MGALAIGILFLLAVVLVPAPGAHRRRPEPAPSPVQEYRIGAKDVLKVTVWGHEDLSRQVVVTADGTFQFPLIGDVKVAGLTPSAVETLLRDLLGKDYLVNPQVSVSVQEFRSQRVFVLGEVEKPGAALPLTGQAFLLGPPACERMSSRVACPVIESGRWIIQIAIQDAEIKAESLVDGENQAGGHVRRPGICVVVGDDHDAAFIEEQPGRKFSPIRLAEA